MLIGLGSRPYSSQARRRIMSSRKATPAEEAIPKSGNTLMAWPIEFREHDLKRGWILQPALEGRFALWGQLCPNIRRSPAMEVGSL